MEEVGAWELYLLSLKFIYLLKEKYTSTLLSKIQTSTAVSSYKQFYSHSVILQIQVIPEIKFL